MIHESSSAKLTSRELRDVYSRLAPFYAFWRRFEGSTRATLIESLAIANGATVLEIGMGTGSAFEELADVNHAGVTVGIDLSGAMLGHAVRTLPTSTRHRTAITQSDARRLPLVANSVDVIYCAYTLDAMPIDDIQIAIAEMRRVLKPAGRLALIYLRCGVLWSDTIWNILSWLVPNLLGGCRPIDLSDYLPEAGFAIASVQRLRVWGMPAEMVICVRR
jgi:ubiquinone/menaquinone biosynthesis C-methylase UbiE